MMFLSDLSEANVILNIYETCKPDLEGFDSSLVLPGDPFSALQTGLVVWHTQWQASVNNENIRHFPMLSILSMSTWYLAVRSAPPPLISMAGAVIIDFRALVHLLCFLSLSPEIIGFEGVLNFN